MRGQDEGRAAALGRGDPPDGGDGRRGSQRTVSEIGRFCNHPPPPMFNAEARCTAEGSLHGSPTDGTGGNDMGETKRLRGWGYGLTSAHFDRLQGKLSGPTAAPAAARSQDRADTTPERNHAVLGGLRGGGVRP